MLKRRCGRTPSHSPSVSQPRVALGARSFRVDADKADRWTVPEEP